MPRDIYPYLQQMLDSFDEISRILRNDELVAREELEKLQRERAVMLEELVQLQEEQQDRTVSAITKVAGTNDHRTLRDQDRGMQSSTENYITLERGEILEDRHEYEKHLEAGRIGLHSDINDVPLQPHYLIERKKYNFKDERCKMMKSDSFPPPILHDVDTPLNGSRLINHYGYNAEKPYLVNSKSSSKDDMGERRVPGTNSTLSMADLKVGKSSSQIDTNMRTIPNSSKKEGTFWINVWPCFGTFASSVSKPTRVVVSGSYRYMEQLTEKAGIATGCQPAPSVLYEPDGRPIRSLAQLVPEQHYLLFPSGGFYRREALPHALLEELVRAARMALRNRCNPHEN
ncbi:hypothetical protein LSM04_005970 [Trypanosoma melophagium]|uniref:uncharacterized protein n=1 Tax=Trypanosoma melophagium TaxID=715481 RepID=UPI00351A2E18|nr:hypothetical protein LSM04_005970 [Trypanosoma melophagium]